MKKYVCLWAFFTAMSMTVSAQTFTDPVSYMDAIMGDHRKITEEYLRYNSSVAHSKNDKEIEKKHDNLIISVKDAIVHTEQLPDYKGNAALKKAALDYLNITYKVLNEDYAQIVDMEAISEQSYDDMEAYLMALEAVNKKMDEAGDTMKTTYNNFAAANKVTIVNKEDDLDKKMKKTGEVNTYYDKAFLIFYKSYRQSMYLGTAVGAQNLNAIEQNRSQLEKDTKQGLEDLAALGAFDGDDRLVKAGTNLFNFYLKECTELVPAYMDYFLKNERFAQQKKDFEALKRKSQQDVDEYNSAVNDLNESVEKSNAASEEMNKSNEKYINEWNEAVSDFLAKHMPFMQ